LTLLDGLVKSPLSKLQTPEQLMAERGPQKPGEQEERINNADLERLKLGEYRR